jgi:hypothetical protein
VGIDISGTTQAVLTPGTASNYAAETTSENLAYSALVEVRDTASLLVRGGTFDGPGVGYGSNPSSGTGPCVFLVVGGGSLVLDDVVVRAVNHGVTMLGGSVTLLHSTLEARAVTTGAWGIRVNNSADPVELTLVDSTIRGFNGAASSGGIVIASGGGNHPSASVSVEDVTLEDNGLGVLVDGLSSATVGGSGLVGRRQPVRRHPRHRCVRPRRGRWLLQPERLLRRGRRRAVRWAHGRHRHRPREAAPGGGARQRPPADRHADRRQLRPDARRERDVELRPRDRRRSGREHHHRQRRRRAPPPEST